MTTSTHVMDATAPPPVATPVGMPPAYEWRDLPWKQFERQVFKLQKRIYRASQRGDTRRVHQLQRLLVHSNSAKLLATRRVTQDNSGKKTADVAGISVQPQPGEYGRHRPGARHVYP